MNLDWNHASSSIIDYKIIEYLKNFDEIIIFGAGQSGEWVLELLKQNYITPVCFCDNSPMKQNRFLCGLKVMSFDAAIELYPNAAICVASMWSEDIMKQIKSFDRSLMNRTWDLLTTMAWETTSLCKASTEFKYIKENLESFEALYALLADDTSRDTLEGLLNYRLTRNKEYLYSIKSCEDTYFDKTLVNGKLEENVISGTIIDGGAFDGDTVKLILERYRKTRRKLSIACYEMEARNVAIIRQNAKLWRPHDIIIHDTALWNTSGEVVSFFGDGLSGTVANSSDRMGENVKYAYTEKIDDGGYECVSMIKLDIEGAERTALLGARETIEKHCPVLAICAYHLQDDLIVLSDVIRSFHCQYSLYLRHYMYSSGDTVLYAIPAAN